MAGAVDGIEELFNDETDGEYSAILETGGVDPGWQT